MAVESRLYDLLGVSPSATQAEIKKAYRKKAVQNHPDRGGDTQLMQEINVANEILSDPEKRQVYDSRGLDGLQEQRGGGGMDAADLFGNLFGGLFGGAAGQRRTSGRPSRPQPAVFDLPVTLEELFSGVTKKMRITREVPCAPCSGSGAAVPNAERLCPACNGHGVRVVTRRLGAGMVQQMQTACQECGGSGRFLPWEATCKVCRGQKTHTERKVLEVIVPPGARDEAQIVCPGEGSHRPGSMPGDVVWVVRTARHPRFVRRGDSLLSAATVSLADALTGCRVKLQHLDGRGLVLITKPGQVVKPGSWQRVSQEGMPASERPGPRGRGDLFVRFEVTFPEHLGSTEAGELVQALQNSHASTQADPSQLLAGGDRPSTMWTRLLHALRSLAKGGSLPSVEAPLPEGAGERTKVPPLGAGEVECYLEEVQGAEGAEIPHSRL